MDVTVLHTLEFHKIKDALADITGSSLGRELVEELLPASDPDEVRKRLDETDEAVGLLSSAVNVPLGGIRDIRELVRRAEMGSVLEPHELVAVGSTLYAARRLKQFFAEQTEPTPLLTGRADRITVFRSLENTIENTVSEQGAVRDSASSELTRIRREIRTAQHRVKEKLDSILHSADYQKYFQDALVTIRGDRYVIPVKQEYRSHFPGIVHDQSASGATVFIEPMPVVNLNNELKQLMAAEKNEIERILRQLAAQVAAIAGPLRDTCQALGELDFVFAKARLAINMKAVKPELNTEGRVGLRQARHPLIPADVVVPIDVQLGHDFNILVITGPNTGGKTVSLKTVGLFALMTQAGLFIPAATDSIMPIFENIFADIGDEQSIEQSLSTFSAHMTNLVRILRQVGGNDLVLIDEIGAGTDPDEGAALAMAILEFLLERQVKVIATTHYSELKTFAYARHGIENGSVEFDIQTLRPTYRLVIGLPGSSKAFLISRRLGLSAGIISRAQELIDEDYAEFDRVLTGLEEQKRLYAERQSEAQRLQRDVEQLRGHLAREQESIAAKKNQILEKAQTDAAAVLRQARKEAEEVIAELKAQFASQNERDRQRTIDGARRRIRAGLEKVHEVDTTGAGGIGKPATTDAMLPGTNVYVTSLGQKGTVINVSGDEATIQLGIMKITVPVESCRLLEEPASKHKAVSYGVNLVKSQQISREIDIRGMTIEEAENLLDKYLDDALLAGLSEVNIIHGKGTGALRKGIRAYLKQHRNVKETRIGEIGEGGDGVTVAKLK